MKIFLVNMETINADVKELDSKYTKAVAEQERKGEENCPQALNIFLVNVKSKIQILREGLKLAHDAFIECAEFYGETTRNIQANAFFTRIASFLKHFEQAVNENEARRMAEQVSFFFNDNFLIFLFLASNRRTRTQNSSTKTSPSRYWFK